MLTRTRELTPLTSLASTAIGRPTSADALPVEGHLPDDLRGCFLQSRPHPSRGAGAAFGGAELITGVRIGDGTARWYRAQAPGTCPSAGAVPAPAPWARPGAPGTRLLAQPVQDPATCQWHTIATTAGSTVAEHLVIGRSGAASPARSFSLGAPTLVTTLALTRDHLVVFDLSVVHDRAAELVGLRPPYSWRADKPARIGLLPRNAEHAEPRWFPVAPGFTSQAVNAFEEDGKVVVDAVRHDGAFDGGPAPRPHLGRWTLDLATGAVTERRLVEAVDTAGIDPAACGRAHRYVHGTSGHTVFRHDLRTSTSQVHDLGAGRRGGRPVLVAGRTGDRLLVVAEDPGRRSSALLVFDAHDLAAGPCASIRLPGAFPAVDRTTWRSDEERSPW
ncbi:carotenoid oxygenase family protein [Saccharothrix yanglingensis]|uniref:carotenoid oxygenase family protein n=1 Tax=Saccharothrix yanglingensis TaxID=659496 RepID=UPI0027D26758|nr:carotenoid oxygenase family protein [Saccharothrix yanglingensis]